MALNLVKQYDLVDVRPVKWDEEGKIVLYIAPLSTKGYQDAMNTFHRWAQTQQSGFRRGVRDREIEDARTEAMRKALAEHVIKDWSGVQDMESGEEVAYTKEKGYELLGDNSFLLDVVAAAADTDAYRRDRVEAASKNSVVLSASGDGSGSTTKRRAASSSVS